MIEHTDGHSVLVIPVPELDGWVRERTAYYDASFLGRDDSFINAHITLLGPWIPQPTPADLEKVASIAAVTPSFHYSLENLGIFPDGLIYLDPLPVQPFTTLTAKLSETFPDYPPYAGTFGSVVPHLTLDRAGKEVSLESVTASLGKAIPKATRATRIDLQWWENNNCHVMASWRLIGQVG